MLLSTRLIRSHIIRHHLSQILLRLLNSLNHNRSLLLLNNVMMVALLRTTDYMQGNWASKFHRNRLVTVLRANNRGFVHVWHFVDALALLLRGRHQVASLRRHVSGFGQGLCLWWCSVVESDSFLVWGFSVSLNWVLFRSSVRCLGMLAVESRTSGGGV